MSTQLERKKKKLDEQSNDQSNNENLTSQSKSPPQTQTSQKTNGSDLYDLYTSLYYPNGYTGSLKSIANTLNTFSGYSLHKQKRKNFKRRRIFVPGPFHSFQGDLIEYSNSKMAHANNNYRFILLLIDCFTKKIYARPLKTKKASETAEALDEILSSLPWPIAFFSSDKGGEFDIRNTHIHNILIKKHRVRAFTLSGKTKAAIAERAIRTLKTRFARYFTESGTTKWITVLDQFVNNYNNSFHSSIGMSPNDVTPENTPEIKKRLYGEDHAKPDCKLGLNDLVRIPLEKNIFAKVCFYVDLIGQN